MDSSQGPDGGSEGSYESVASDGGFEPAAERGRDPMPRMISSSHCIEVFQRMRCVDGVYVRQSSGEVPASRIVVGLARRTANRRFGRTILLTGSLIG